MRIEKHGKGVNFNDRELAGEVRTLTLNEIKRILSKQKPKSLYGAVLVKLAGNILPRLNEVTGEGGKPLIIQVSGTLATKYGIDTSAGQNSGKQ